MAGLLRRTMLAFGLADDLTDDRVDDLPDDLDEYTVHNDHEVTDTRPGRARVRRIATLHARRFNSDAPMIGDLFRTGTSVIIDLTGADEPTTTRFLDFSAGLAFGHSGRIEKVAPSVYLLSCEGVAA